MAVDSDGGRINHSLWNDTMAGTGSAQTEWWGKSWGRPAEGSICPSAPERSKKDSTALTSGSVDSAWVSGFTALVVPAGGKLGSITFAEIVDRRVGSYTPNGWIIGGWLENRREDAFRSEAEVQNPARTPLFGDGISQWSAFTVIGWGPTAADLPAKNLQTGRATDIRLVTTRDGVATFSSGMSAFTIPRHGSRPLRVPTNHPAEAKLPGAVNVAFYDGHVETTPLERLWSLDWHKGYVVPAKRPGLK